MKWKISILLALSLFGTSLANEPIQLTSAIFVVNRADASYNDQIPVLRDMLASRLIDKGLSVIAYQDVLTQFNDAGALQQITRAAAPSDERIDQPIDELALQQSAKKLARLVNADYMLFASINAITTDLRKGEAYGQKMGAKTVTVRMAVNVLDRQGATLAGAFVQAKDRTPLQDSVQIIDGDIIPRLLDQCATKATDQLGQQVSKIIKTQPASENRVNIAISANVSGATVLIDGIAYGTTPCQIQVPQEPSTLKLVLQDFRTLQTFINPFEGQQVNMTLELSEGGLARWKDIESFKLAQEAKESAIKIAEEQSEADAYAKKQIAEGEKTFRENSRINEDGFAEQLKEVIHGD